MSDLISRQAAIAAVGYYSLHSGDKLLFADAPLKALPTVDPVKHGRWIYYEDETIEDGGRCSVCQCDQPVFLEDWKWEFVETAYCPNCGAKMDEVEE